MKKRIRTRDYKMSDAKLIQTADNFRSIGNRDLAELAVYNIDVAWMTNFENKRDEFSNTPTDVELMGDMIYATQQKNAARNVLLEEIRQMDVRAEFVFGKTDGRYRSFGFEDLSKQKDEALVRTGGRVFRRGTAFLTELGAKGLTVAMLTNLSNVTDDFDDKIDDQEDAVYARDIAVDERIRIGNELYAMLVELGEMGKAYWATRNEAKYNDYIIYRNPSEVPPQFETEGEVLPNLVVSTSVSGVSTNTVFELNNTNEAILEFYFAQTPTDPTGPNVIVVAPNSQLTVPALNLGFNEENGFTYLNVRNPSPQMGGYRILWGD